MVQVLPSGDFSHFSASSGMYAPVCRSMPTRNSRAGLLSRLALRGLSQVKLVSQPVGAMAILSRSSLLFAGAGGVTVCAQATVTVSPMAPNSPHSTPQRLHLFIVLSSRLQRRLDILQVCKGAGDHPWEHILCDILGVHRRFCEQPEQRDLSKLGELMVPDLP